MAIHIRRRDFITLRGGAAAAWPLAARTQQPDGVRRIGVLMSSAADNPGAPARVTAIAQGLQELGWTVGRNVRIDYRWGAGDIELFRKYAAELVALKPDCHPGHGRLDRRGTAAGEPHGADRLRDDGRSRGWRLG